MLTGCHTSNKEAVSADADEIVVAPRPIMGGEGSQQMVPRAVVYRTSGDYDNNVPITLNAAGDGVVSFPAPSDLSESSTPLKLNGGYLLDRRGIGRNTVFTTWTYKDYMALKKAPSTDELLKSVIPDSRVVEIVELPIAAGEAWRNVGKCNGYVADGFQGCKIVYKVPEVKK